MKAVVFTQYGPADLLQFTELAKPVPKDNEVLIKLYATGVNAADWRVMKAEPFLARLQFGLRKPRINILGADITGQVEAVGKNVTQFKPGDEVFGDLSGHGFGGFAEYVAVPETAVILKSPQMTFEEAAALPLASVTALQALRDNGQIKPGQKVLINGASGGVGTYAVQIAKAFGAEVTGVCSTKKIDMVRSLGADHIIDYTKENFTRSGKQYDLILAANGYHPIADYKRALVPGGIYVMAGGSMKQLFEALVFGPWHSMTSGKKMGNVLAAANTKDLAVIKQLFETRKLIPVMDRCYPLSETAEAIRYVQAGHAHGKVIISIVGNSKG